MTEAAVIGVSRQREPDRDNSRCIAFGAGKARDGSRLLRCTFTALLALALMLAMTQVFAATACEAAPDAEHSTSEVFVLQDTTTARTIAEVAEMPPAAFAPLAGKRPRVGADRPLWLRICLPDGARDHVLAILPPYLQQITLYTPAENGFEAHTRVRYGASGQDDVDYRSAAFLLSATGNATSQWFVEMRSVRTMTPEITLLEATAWSRFVARDYALFGLYLGMLLLAATVNLLFWLHQRDRIHLRYAFAILAIAAYSATVGGYLTQWLSGTPPWLHESLTSGSYAASAALLTLFLLDAFRMRLYYPVLYQLGRLAFVAFGVLGLLAALHIDLGFDPYRAMLRMSLVCIVLGSVMTLHALLRHRSVRIYALAMLPLLLGLLANSMSHRVQALSPVISDQLPHLGALAHLILLNLGLARRAQRNERMRHRAQAAALRAAQASEHELQLRIEDRTLELRTANLQLMHEIDERTAAQMRVRETLEGERRTAHRERQLLAMLSHELRTPLAVIDTAAQSLANGLREVPPLFTKRIERIRHSVSRLSSLAHNMLTRDRLSEPSRLYLRAHDLRATLNNRLATGEAAQRIRVHVPDEAVLVTIDPELIDIAVSNLVGNALKYSPPDQPVDLHLYTSADEVIIEVSDRGPGIPDDARELLFDRYFRVDAEWQPDGTGLGLYLSREIARRHGGDVELAPPREGGGSTFLLYLPRDARPDTAGGVA